MPGVDEVAHRRALHDEVVARHRVEHHGLETRRSAEFAKKLHLARAVAAEREIVAADHDARAARIDEHAPGKLLRRERGEVVRKRQLGQQPHPHARQQLPLAVGVEQALGAVRRREDRQRMLGEGDDQRRQPARRRLVDRSPHQRLVAQVQAVEHANRHHGSRRGDPLRRGRQFLECACRFHISWPYQARAARFMCARISRDA